MLASFSAFPDIEQQSADIQGGKHAHHDPDEQRDGKTADLVGTDHVEHHGHQQRGDIGIDNCGKGPAKAILDGHADCSSTPLFLTNPFKNQHIRVNRHSDCQHQAGQAGQRESGLDEDHRPHHQHQVQQQANHGHDAREAVITDHEDDNRDRCDSDGRHALLLHIAAQGGRNCQFADRLLLQRDFECPGLEHTDQLVDLFTGEITRDLSTPTDAFIERRCGEHFAVENDRQVSIKPLRSVGFVGAGQFRELEGSRGIQTEADSQPAVLVVGLIDVVEVFPRHPQVFLVGHQHVIDRPPLQVGPLFEHQLIPRILNISPVLGNGQPGPFHL